MLLHAIKKEREKKKKKEPFSQSAVHRINHLVDSLRNFGIEKDFLEKNS